MRNITGDIMVYILIFFYIIINVVFDIFEFAKRYISAGLLVSLSQLLMFIGVAKLADFKNEADILLLELYFLGYLCFAFFYLILVHKYSFSNISYNVNYGIDLYQKRMLYCLIVFSTCISVVFFVLSGVNIIQTILGTIIHDSVVNISEMRKSINFTKGNGIVYQLRNFILPLSVLYLMIFENGKRRYVGVFFLPFAIVFLIGSGQRAGLVYLMLIIIISVLFSIKISKKQIQNISSRRNVKKRKRRIYFIVGTLIIIFVALTVLNGRNQVSGSLVKAIQDRFINDNQFCAILGFRYIYDQRITYGADWINMFIDLFRGNRYIPVASLIHAQLYGSIQGTSPPCIWGSAYYNFGYLGIIIISLFLAIVSKELYAHLCKRNNNGLRLLLFIGMFVLLATWIADSPIMLLNGGFLTIVAMYIILFPKMKIVLNRRKKY